MHFSEETLSRTIYVGNLDPSMDQETIKSVFITFGDIKHVEIPKDYQTGKPRGYAFVEFEDKEDAGYAIDNYDDAEVYGRIIKVKKAKPVRLKASSTRAVWEDESWHKKNIDKMETEETPTEAQTQANLAK